MRVGGAASPGRRAARRCAPLAAALLSYAWSAAGTVWAAAQSPLDELRHSFTVAGNPVPPEIFRDMGDGDLADSGSIWVAVDVGAATGSNLYADPIAVDGPWISQAKAPLPIGAAATVTAYRFVGTTRNNLLVVIARYSGGGTGVFTTLHILDAGVTPGFDPDGKRDDRLTLTAVRDLALGDRWAGKVTITGNTVAITTTGDAPAGPSRKPSATTIEAERP